MGFDLCYGILFCAGEGACGPQLWSTPRRLAQGRSDSVRQGLNVSCNTGEGVYIDSQIPLSSERNKRSLTPTRALEKTRASLTEFGMTRQRKT